MVNFVYNFSKDYESSTINRTLIVGGNNFNIPNDDFESIEHIELYDSKKYLYGVEYYAKTFDIDKYEGMIFINPILSLSDIALIKGSYPNDNEIVCPINFYPYSLYQGDNLDMVFNKKLLINGNSMINKVLNISNDENDYDFKVVGSYKNIIFDEVYTCYTNKDTFDKLKSNIEMCSDQECFTYDSYIVRVDDIKNMDYVKNELTNRGYSYMNYNFLDQDLINNLSSIPLFVGIVVILVMVIILSIYIYKYRKNNNNKIKMLKALGFSKQNILNIFYLKIFIIYTLSYLIHVILFIVAFNVISNKYLSEIFYSNYYVEIPMILFFIEYIIILIYIIIYSGTVIKKTISKVDWI
jgi:hypothetical protein